MPIILADLARPTETQALAIRVRDTLRLILDTGDIVGRDEHGRTFIQLTVDELQLEELATFGAELEDLEPEPTEDDRAY